MLDGMMTHSADGGSVVHFERRIERPIEAVWAALTVPERLSDWLAVATVDLALGGHYHLRFHDSTDEMSGFITRIEPPGVLEYTWRESNSGPESRVLWRLEADGSGCFLKFTHIFPPGTEDSESFRAGWHLHLDALPAACDRVPTRWDRDRWTSLYEAYKSARI